MRKCNYILSVLVAAIAGYIYYLAEQFPAGAVDVLGAAFWPEILCKALFVLAAVLALATAFGGEHAQDAVTFFKTHDQLLVWMIVGAVAIFLVLIKLIGFLPAAAVFLPGAYLILGEGKILKIAALDLGLVIFIWLVFCQLLNVQLPTGILF